MIVEPVLIPCVQRPRRLPVVQIFLAISIVVLAGITVDGVISHQGSFACFPPVERTRMQVDAVRGSVMTWLIAQKADSCPRRAQLLEFLRVEPEYLQDWWGHDLTITCGETAFLVRSYGPDGEPGTADDIVSR